MQFPLLTKFAVDGVGTYYVVNTTDSRPSRAASTVTVVCLWDPAPPPDADPEEIEVPDPGRQTVGRVVADDAAPGPGGLCRSYVTSLNVEHEHQGRMIGCMLLEAAECILYEQARELGCGRRGVEVMLLPDLTESLRTLTGRAARFYYQQGYEFRGTYVYFGERPVNPKFFKLVGPRACRGGWGSRLRGACRRAKAAYADSAEREKQERELRTIVAAIHGPDEYERNLLADETTDDYKQRARATALDDLRRRQMKLFGVEPPSPFSDVESDDSDSDEEPSPPPKRRRVEPAP